MPELPEVEVLKEEIKNKIVGNKLKILFVREKRFRWPIQDNIEEIVRNKTILDCSRRGKYILIHFENGIQLIHLGMSGSLRFNKTGESLVKHDHVEWLFENFSLRLNDPRRFGALLWHPGQNGSIENHPLIGKLGIEPLSNYFDGHYLYNHLKNYGSCIKTVLMNGYVVVGVGNIYASESLFRAKINPMQSAKNLSCYQCDILANKIKEILYESIMAGGSTLKNFFSTEGKSGKYIENHAFVYNKQGEKCRVCREGTILKIKQNNRSTYYCPNCQVT